MVLFKEAKLCCTQHVTINRCIVDWNNGDHAQGSYLKIRVWREQNPLTSASGGRDTWGNETCWNVEHLGIYSFHGTSGAEENTSCLIK